MTEVIKHAHTENFKANLLSLLRPDESWGLSTLTSRTEITSILCELKKFVTPGLSHVLSLVPQFSLMFVVDQYLTKDSKWPFCIFPKLSHYAAPSTLIFSLRFTVHSTSAFQSFYLYFLNSDYLTPFVIPIPVLSFQSLSCNNGTTTSCASALKDYHPVLPEFKWLDTLRAYIFFFFWLSSYGLFPQQLVLHGPTKMPLGSFTTNI